MLLNLLYLSEISQNFVESAYINSTCSVPGPGAGVGPRYSRRPGPESIRCVPETRDQSLIPSHRSYNPRPVEFPCSQSCDSEEE